MLSEADAGLANVKACSGDKAAAARYVRASRQRSQSPTHTADRPRGPAGPGIDLSQGVASVLRHLPLATTPAQGVAMNDVYKHVQDGLGDEVLAHARGERAAAAPARHRRRADRCREGPP